MFRASRPSSRFTWQRADGRKMFLRFYTPRVPHVWEGAERSSLKSRTLLNLGHTSVLLPLGTRRRSWRRHHVPLCLSRCSGPVALGDGARLAASCFSPRFGSFVHLVYAPPPSPITLPPLQITHQPRRSSPRYPQMATSCGPAR